MCAVPLLATRQSLDTRQSHFRAQNNKINLKTVLLSESSLDSFVLLKTRIYHKPCMQTMIYSKNDDDSLLYLSFRLTFRAF